MGKHPMLWVGVGVGIAIAVFYLTFKRASDADTEREYWKSEAERYKMYVTLSDHYTKAAKIVWGDKAKRCDAGLVSRTDGLVKKYGDSVATLTKILALMTIESGFNEKIESVKGAKGLMQLMPGTARSHEQAVTDRDLENEVTNTRIGIKEYVKMYRTFNDDELALLAYNCGPAKIAERFRAGKLTGNDYVVKTLQYEFVSNSLTSY